MSLTIALESWDAFWPEADDLVRRHYAEVAGEIDPQRPYKIDVAIMRDLEIAGMLKILAARLDGRLIGYLTWNVHLDPESEGLPVADQGGWYVADEPGLAHLGLGLKLYRRSIEELKAMGVKMIFPHHRNRGRGANLGTIFRRLGAVEIQHGYSLWIGD